MFSSTSSVLVWLVSLRLSSAENQTSAHILGPGQVAAWHGRALVPQPSALWSQLLGPIGTVCVAGDDRIGKSTLLTHWGRALSGDAQFEFSAGHSRDSHTKGLWSAILPSALTGLKFHVNLCDSQGLKQVGEVEQQRLFSANVLLPSVLVFMVYNVIQNDQLRDLAHLAHQFQQLSAEELGRFGRVLSPHLIVVVREESDLDNDESNDGLSLSDHLESALSGDAFAEDKALIRRVFQSRDAWALRELPRESRKAFRAQRGTLTIEESLAEGSPWQRSGDVVLSHILARLDDQQDEVPQSGLELAEWYRSALEVANSHEDGSITRLIGHSEHLAAGRRRRLALEEWKVPLLLVLVVLALQQCFSGWLGRCLDTVAWIAWIALSVCHVGTSHLVTVPLHGLAPYYCEQLLGKPANVLWKGVCHEASPYSAALLLAVILGAVSYPLLSMQLRWLVGRLPLPRRTRRVLAALAVTGLVAGLGAVNPSNVDSLAEDLSCLFLINSLLTVVFTIAAGEMCFVACRNWACVLAGHRARSLHWFVVARLPQLQKLESSSEWTYHYARHDQRDAIWRFRRQPQRHAAAVCAQACALLAWGQLIYPHCDPALVLGGVGNASYLVWRGARSLRSLCCGSADEVQQWLGELSEESDCEEPAMIVNKYGRSRDGSSYAVATESDADRQTRLAIEEMRRAQESAAYFWRRLPT
mmetsp:Transcript_2002/g.5704  ORF Transcript_2002/g.5704 Transcript_2002/m.5704 type:complete len:699 (-) Transcript_2002:340-2436(-)